MFDPTIFDNIKVVLEGEIYDLDLSGTVNVIGREDQVNLAAMTRKFIVKFKLADSKKDLIAEINLSAGTEDLAKEILESREGYKPGCEIIIKFMTQVTEPKAQCRSIEEILNKIWDDRPEISQILSYEYKKEKQEKLILNNEITLNFGRKIDEDNIGDIHVLLEYTLRSLDALNTI